MFKKSQLLVIALIATLGTTAVAAPAQSVSGLTHVQPYFNSGLSVVHIEGRAAKMLYLTMTEVKAVQGAKFSKHITCRQSRDYQYSCSMIVTDQGTIEVLLTPVRVGS